MDKKMENEAIGETILRHEEEVKELKKRISLMESVLFKLLGHSHDNLGRPVVLLEKL